MHTYMYICGYIYIYIYAIIKLSSTRVSNRVIPPPEMAQLIIIC